MINNNMGVRHLQVMLNFFCLTVNYMQQGNIGVILVLIEAKKFGPSFVMTWEEEVRILVGFYGFYILTTMLAGYLGTKINNKYLLLLNGVFSTVLSYSTPSLIKKFSHNVLYVIRMMQGISHGFILPQVYGQMSRWIPPTEITYLGPITVSGMYFGVGFITCMGGYLGESTGGWQSIFYFSGNCGLIWCLTYAAFASQEPDTCWFISDEERIFINKALINRAKGSFRRHVPWIKMITSLPPYALVVTHCAQNWGLHTLAQQYPRILFTVFDSPIDVTCMLTGLPLLLLVLTTFPSSLFAYYLLMKKKTSLKTLRFTANSLGQWGLGVCLLFMAFSSQMFTIMFFYCLGYMLSSCQLFGMYLNHFDLAPNFAGMLFGWTAGLSNIASGIGSYVSSMIFNNYSAASRWRAVIFMCAINYIFGNLFYIMFGSVEVQSFNATRDSDIEDDDESEIAMSK